VKDGYVYFGQGTATNSGIVGQDNASFGWLLRHNDFHDIACRDIMLAGQNYTSSDILKKDSADTASHHLEQQFLRGKLLKGASRTMKKEERK
jgi:hypothetical protein